MPIYVSDRILRVQVILMRGATSHSFWDVHLAVKLSYTLSHSVVASLHSRRLPTSLHAKSHRYFRHFHSLSLTYLLWAPNTAYYAVQCSCVGMVVDC